MSDRHIRAIEIRQTHSVLMLVSMIYIGSMLLLTFSMLSVIIALIVGQYSLALLAGFLIVVSIYGVIKTDGIYETVKEKYRL